MANVLNQRLYEARLHADLSIRELAEKLHTNTLVISAIEERSQIVENADDFDGLKKWAVACGVSAHWLLTGDPDYAPESKGEEHA